MQDLVKIIKDNPGCVATIDNDSWWLSKGDPEPEGFEDWDWDQQEKWRDAQEIAHWGLVTQRGEGYGSGNCYGGDILQALAEIVGIRIESV